MEKPYSLFIKRKKSNTFKDNQEKSTLSTEMYYVYSPMVVADVNFYSPTLAELSKAFGIFARQVQKYPGFLLLLLLLLFHFLKEK